MKAIYQSTEDLILSLSSLETEWRDDTANAAIEKLATLEKKSTYTVDDVASLMDGSFEIGILCARLFLAFSKDRMEQELRSALGGGGIGSKRYRANRDDFIEGLISLGLLESMTAAVNHQPTWSDILVERLRSGRGSAIQGQKRGRDLEDFVEAIVAQVFGDGYRTRCTFTGTKGRTAKCDFVIPGKDDAKIIIEAKGYAATGSKMSDIIGDLDAIIDAKRADSRLLFVTDGMSWLSRQSDLRKIVKRQNDGDIMKIYTSKMQEDLASDLVTLKTELGI